MRFKKLLSFGDSFIRRVNKLAYPLAGNSSINEKLLADAFDTEE